MGTLLLQAAKLHPSLSVCVEYWDGAKKPIEIERWKKYSKISYECSTNCLSLVYLTTNIWQMPFTNEIKHRFSQYVGWISFCWLPISAMMIMVVEVVAATVGNFQFMHSTYFGCEVKPKIFVKSISKVSMKLFNIRSYNFTKLFI